MCQFDFQETPYFPPPEGLEDYVFLAAVPLEERVRGLVGATERKQCQVFKAFAFNHNHNTMHFRGFWPE